MATLVPLEVQRCYTQDNKIDDEHHDVINHKTTLKPVVQKRGNPNNLKDDKYYGIPNHMTTLMSVSKYIDDVSHITEMKKCKMYDNTDDRPVQPVHSSVGT